ncbi:MAG: cbb3-type cytochrome c oxidase subunit I [Candidatus Eremiobacteraeota bacterium]|nr:cbb3-type cytochrome c oxidase subunit I [Candidatus Eremiobacteraeota bacterium]MBV9647054.1 cbb3-type cytochrome c oxidase subunit I [Candidatus Eremiobacteraeota bacterium]
MEAGTTAPHVGHDPHDHIHPPPEGFIRKYVFSLDHKVIAFQYFITGLLFMLIAGSFAELIRLQLWEPNGAIMSHNAYDTMFTIHGTAMVWLVVIPLVTGALGNFVMPLQIGARDVAFPWLNMLSFWILPVAGLTLFSTFLAGGAHAGWTEYPPISLADGTAGALWCAAIFLVGISSTITGLNFMVTIIKMRAPGMTWTRMPLFIWASFATAFMNMFATVALSSALFALFLEHVFNVPFFDANRGGSAVLYEHMFWFYSHPAVYIFILPAFGVISEILPVFARKPIFGYKMIAFSSLAIAILSFAVWAHHMFPSGISPWLQLTFMIITYAIGVPTGIKVFSWIATLWAGRIHFTTAMLYAMGFLITFTFGGITGIFLASVPADFHEHGTYFVVAHFHYVVAGGALMGFLAAIPYWYPKATGRLMSERMGRWSFWLFFIGFNATFFPMHWLGLEGMPRRYASYVAFATGNPDAVFWNQFETVFSFLMVVSIGLLAWNMIWSIRHGKPAGINPWGARTLEWTISSPPPYYNFRKIPIVYDRPYDFDKPLPYRNLDNDIDAYPEPSPVLLRQEPVRAGA